MASEYGLEYSIPEVLDIPSESKNVHRVAQNHGSVVRVAMN